jgi:hypothetical protein
MSAELMPEFVVAPDAPVEAPAWVVAPEPEAPGQIEFPPAVIETEPLQVPDLPVEDPNIVDGDWRIVDPQPLQPGIVPEWQPEPLVNPVAPTYQPEPLQARPGWQVGAAAAAPQPTSTNQSVPWSSPLPAPSASWLPSRLPIALPSFSGALDILLLPVAALGNLLFGWLSFDWMTGSSAHGYAPVDYVTYAVPSKHGATTHYHLVNVCKIRVGSETYTDNAEFLFNVPIYHKGKTERALDKLDLEWRRING